MDWTDRIGRRLRLRDLHVLMAVVEQGSMARAAEHLAVSRPVISRAITDLEHTLGARLLDRTPSGIEPTVYGRALLRRGGAVFDELRQGVQDIAFLSDPNEGELRLGCFDPLVAGITTNVLASLAARFPKLTFEVFSSNSDGLPQMLRERQVEFVLIRAPADAPAPDFAAEPLHHEKLVIAAAAHSRWARQRKLLLTDLAQARWISSPNEFRSPCPLFQAFHAQGIPVPHPVIQSTSLVLRYNLLLRGDFVTMIPISA